MQHIVAAAIRQRVVALAANQHIVTGAAGDGVIVGATVEEIRTLEAINGVITGEARNIVALDGSVKQIRPCCAGDLLTINHRQRHKIGAAGPAGVGCPEHNLKQPRIERCRRRTGKYPGGGVECEPARQPACRSAGG